jgi:hypothetical protein
MWVAAGILICTASACGADMSQRVKSRAARDFACSEDQTRIVDAADGVYRVTGCGMVASYQCGETASLSMHCEQLYQSKAEGESDAPQGDDTSSMAKAN